MSDEIKYKARFSNPLMRSICLGNFLIIIPSEETKDVIEFMNE